jgi:phosphoribosylaminoimidazole carboxylase
MAKRLGILGGGQLGRMLLESANRINIDVVILDKENSPAKQIQAHDQHVSGSFKNAEDIRKLAEKSNVLTIEIEHVDADMLQDLEKQQHGDHQIEIHPSPTTIKIIQDKYVQKQHLRSHDITVVDFVGLRSGSETEMKEVVGNLLGYPFMLKSRTDAYDGRGNFAVMSESSVSMAAKTLTNRPLYAERWAPFKMELAVMVVKTKSTTMAFPVVETIHENNICKLVYAPPRNVSSKVCQKAQDLAKKAVSTFQGKGIYGVEMFLLPDDTLFINEIAPRPHNSGHYTIEGCYMSQYDAHLRAILDLPIPESALRLRTPSIMLNILGGSTPDAHLVLSDAALTVPGASVHLYGKGTGTPGRKMGHITVTAPTMSETSQLISPLISIADQISTGQIYLSTTLPSTVAQEKAQPLVAVIMGSHSDLPTLQPCLTTLTSFSIPFTVRITSAHRTPQWMVHYTSTAAENGIRVIIAAAGGAAHLPGMAAAHTTLPVIGVPVKASSTDGMDSLLSIVQMPRGVPVATVSIGNGVNAALLAARILGVLDQRIQDKVEDYAREAERIVRETDRRLVEEGFEEFLKGMGK